MLSAFNISSFIPNILSDKPEKDKIDSSTHPPPPPAGGSPISTQSTSVDTHLSDSTDGHGHGKPPISQDHAKGPPPVHMKPAIDTETPKKQKREKPTGVNETFIVVRPPPSKSNHPLNLQLQLVPPSQSRDRASRRSMSGDDAPPTSAASSPGSNTAPVLTSGVPLERISSARSNRSDVSLYSSISSTGSMTSLASTTSSARRIIPLYNLTAHNVMTNTITDAGTDAKVAKFQKRALELIGLGMLEPAEVWGNPRDLDDPDFGANTGGGYAFKSTSSVNDAHGSPLHAPGLKISSAISLTSSTDAHTTDTHTDAEEHDMSHFNPADGPKTPTPATAGAGAKKLFGRFFKKKDTSSSTLSPPPTMTSFSRSNSPSGGSHGRSNSLSTPGSVPVHSSPYLAPPALPSKQASSSAPQQTELVLQPPILGLQATLIAPCHPPVGRPSSYTWVFRKWAKEKVASGEGWFGGALDGLGMNANSNPNGSGGRGDVVVRFTWTRGKHPSSRVKRMTSRDAVGQDEEEGGRRPSAFSIQSNTTTGSALGVTTSRVSETLHPPTTSPAPSPSASRISARSARAKASMDPIPLDRTRSPSPQPSTRDGSPEHEHANPMSGSGGAAASRVRSRSHSRSRRGSDSRPVPPIVAGGAEEDEDSDPEDSETPWYCVMTVVPPNPRPADSTASPGIRASLNLKRPSKVPLSGPGRASIDVEGMSAGGMEGSMMSTRDPKEGRVKLKVATLVPAPHHPKVLGQIKIPFPLPDILFPTPSSGSSSAPTSSSSHHTPLHSPHGISILPRTMAPDGSVLRRDGVSEAKAGTMMLTAEEIKDVVSCTSMWLIVREGFGGIDKKRKGDGWRIRG